MSEENQKVYNLQTKNKDLKISFGYISWTRANGRKILQITEHK